MDFQQSFQSNLSQRRMRHILSLSNLSFARKTKVANKPRGGGKCEQKASQVAPVVKEPAYPCRRCKMQVQSLGCGEDPWRRTDSPPPVFLPEDPMD